MDDDPDDVTPDNASSPPYEDEAHEPDPDYAASADDFEPEPEPEPEPARPPVAPPTWNVTPNGAGGHEASVAIPTASGKTLRARGRGRTAGDALAAAFGVASKAVQNRTIAAIVPPQARLLVAGASGLVKLARSGKLKRIAGQVKNAGLRRLAAVFA